MTRVLCREAGVEVPFESVLPCERCWWMPADCTCGRPEARAELFRLAPPAADHTGPVAA